MEQQTWGAIFLVATIIGGVGMFSRYARNPDFETTWLDWVFVAGAVFLAIAYQSGWAPIPSFAIVLIATALVAGVRTLWKRFSGKS